MNDFEGNVNGFGLDNTSGKWAEKSNEILEKRKEPYRVIKKSEIDFYKVIVFLLFISLLVFGGFILYYIHDGKLTRDMNQSIDVQPKFNPTTNNDYTHEIKNDNQFNNNFSFNFNLDEELLDKYCDCNNTG